MGNPFNMDEQQTIDQLTTRTFLDPVSL